MVGALVAFAALGTSIESAAQGSSAAPAPPLIRPHTPTLGPANAKVHLVEFLDPACEGCRAFYPVVKQIIAENPGKIRWRVSLRPHSPRCGLRGQGPGGDPGAAGR